MEYTWKMVVGLERIKNSIDVYTYIFMPLIIPPLRVFFLYCCCKLEYNPCMSVFS